MVMDQMAMCKLSLDIMIFLHCFLTMLQVTGRMPLIIGATIVHAALFSTVLTWRPHAGEDYVLYIIAMLWGLCDSVWMVQINGMW